MASGWSRTGGNGPGIRLATARKSLRSRWSCSGCSRSSQPVYRDGYGGASWDLALLKLPYDGYFPLDRDAGIQVRYIKPDMVVPNPTATTGGDIGHGIKDAHLTT